MRQLTSGYFDGTPCAAAAEASEGESRTAVCTCVLPAATCPVLRNSPEWLRMTVQAKFYKGEVNYSAKEQEMLRTWIKAKGVDSMEKLFYGKILQHKPTLREAYPTTILGRLINSLRG